MASQLAVLTLFLLVLSSQAPTLAAEVAPRITDREIVERLTRLEEGQRALHKRIDDLRAEMNARFATLDKRIDDLRSEMNGRFDSINGRFDSINGRFDSINGRFNSIDGRFDSINGRFDTLQWTLGLFIAIALIILGFVLRLQWQMSRRQTQMETVLGTHREEIAFLKGLIEKLLPPRGTL